MRRFARSSVGVMTLELCSYKGQPLDAAKRSSSLNSQSHLGSTGRLPNRLSTPCHHQRPSAGVSSLLEASPSPCNYPAPHPHWSCLLTWTQHQGSALRPYHTWRQAPEAHRRRCRFVVVGIARQRLLEGGGRTLGSKGIWLLRGVRKEPRHRHRIHCYTALAPLPECHALLGGRQERAVREGFHSQCRPGAQAG